MPDSIGRKIWPPWPCSRASSHATGGAAAGAACLGVIAGVPLVAAGIAEAQLGTGLLPPRMLELVASGLMAASGILVGGLQVRLAARPGRPASARLLLALSGVAVLGPMSLAAAYALGGFTNVVWITIPEMFRYHGAVNALGFALPGLLAWSLMGMEVRPSTRRKHGPGREANPNMKIPRDPDPDEGPGRNRPGLARGEVITESQRIRPIGPTDQPRKIIASLGEMILCPDVFLLYYSQLRTRGRHPSHHDRSSGQGLPA